MLASVAGMVARMMNPHEISERLGQMQIESAALGQRYVGYMNIFNAACTVGNSQDMDNMRLQIHGVVDNILDVNAQIYMLTRQMIQQASKGGLTG